MLKRFLISFVIALCAVTVFNFSNADACVAPLEQYDEKDVTVIEYDDISIQHVQLQIRPASGYVVVTSELVIKNNGEEKNIMMGVPVNIIPALSSTSNIAVSYKGINVKTAKMNAQKATDADEKQPFYNSYYVWTVNVGKNETAFLNVSFNISTRHYENNTECIDIPLDLFKQWSKESGNLEISIESPLLNVYSYDKAPSMLPSSVQDNGTVMWDKEISGYDSKLVVYYNLDDSVLPKYFLNKYSSGSQQEASNLFKTRQYYSAIKLIEDAELDKDDVNFAFMKMVCYEKLGLKDRAFEILKLIYKKNVCFSADNRYDISEYVANRMSYAYYSSIPGLTAEAFSAKKTILEDGIKVLTESKSVVYMKWVKNQTTILDKLIYSNGNQGQTGSPSSGMPSQNPLLSKLKDPIIMTVGVIMIVVVIFCITGMITGKNIDKNKNGRQNRTVNRKRKA